MRWLILTFAAIPLFAGWAWLVFIGTWNGWFREPLAAPEDTEGFFQAASAVIDRESRGNAALRLLDDGVLVGEHYVSTGKPVDARSRFQVASVSKWITAWGVMGLVEAGRVELDAPVSRYLTRWQLPDSAHDNDQVTIRRLLSHTAGLTDGLGYNGFAPGTPVQPLTASLDRAADAMSGADGRVRVGLAPGSEFRYSGGGYTLLQLLIEDVSGHDFETYMQRSVLGPLGMSDSTFVLADDASGVATFYDVDGTPAPHYRYTALGAASLYTTAADLTRFVQAQLTGPRGEPPGRGVLAPETLALMREPHAHALGTEVWGLGLALYTDNGRGGYVVGHDGGNRPAINTTVRFDPATGDGVVLLVTGTRGLASRLGSEWVFWHSGRLDVAMFYNSTTRMYLIVAAGWGVIALAVLALGWLTTRARRAAAPASTT